MEGGKKKQRRRKRDPVQSTRKQPLWPIDFSTVDRRSDVTVLRGYLSSPVTDFFLPSPSNRERYRQSSASKLLRCLCQLTTRSINRARGTIVEVIVEIR